MSDDWDSKHLYNNNGILPQADWNYKHQDDGDLPLWSNNTNYFDTN